MKFSDKVSLSLEIVSDWLSLRGVRPIVLCSFGKDSMVLLHLALGEARRKGIHLPLLFFREPFQEHKFQFANRIIDEWQLDVVTYRPSAVEALEKNGVMEIVNLYAVGDGHFYLPTGVNPEWSPTDFACGLEVAGKPLIPSFDYPWDVTLIGHRADDVDPLHGAIRVERESARVGSTTLVYPLKDWTEKDVWDYHQAHEIPFERRRYDETADFQERADKTYNHDYMDICTRCFQSGGKDLTVACPKTGKDVPYVGHLINHDERLAQRRASFVNLTPKE